jgi:hypothetical protein
MAVQVQGNTISADGKPGAITVQVAFQCRISGDGVAAVYGTGGSQRSERDNVAIAVILWERIIGVRTDGGRILD